MTGAANHAVPDHRFKIPVLSWVSLIAVDEMEPGRMMIKGLLVFTSSAAEDGAAQNRGVSSTFGGRLVRGGATGTGSSPRAHQPTGA